MWLVCDQDRRVPKQALAFGRLSASERPTFPNHAARSKPDRVEGRLIQRREEVLAMGSVCRRKRFVVVLAVKQSRNPDGSPTGAIRIGKTRGKWKPWIELSVEQVELLFRSRMHGEAEAPLDRDAC